MKHSIDTLSKWLMSMEVPPSRALKLARLIYDAIPGAGEGDGESSSSGSDDDPGGNAEPSVSGASTTSTASIRRYERKAPPGAPMLVLPTASRKGGSYNWHQSVLDRIDRPSRRRP